MEARIGDIPEGSRFDKYLKDFSQAKKDNNIDNFVMMVFDDSRAFLRKKLRVAFGKIALTRCYNSRDFQERLFKQTGKYDKNTTAFIIHKPWFTVLVSAEILIDLQTLLLLDEKEFIRHLVLNIMEELLHRVYPLIVEHKKIEAILYPLVEEFLQIKITNKF
jgi:hypothetical protein